MIDLHRSAVDAIRAGDVETLEALLLEHPSPAKARPDRPSTPPSAPARRTWRSGSAREARAGPPSCAPDPDDRGWKGDGNTRPALIHEIAAAVRARLSSPHGCRGGAVRARRAGPAA